ncbi:MAG: hypothetical protein INQ03_08695 [Candidatus Heimdallarchaeota archaeon]|nr:hypothetical protein [Candidatus Heimdallarchaeota archaeon]
MSHIFRAYDVRGIFGEDLSVETMLNIGRAFGTYMKQRSHHRVTVGGDIRASTSLLLKSLVSGIASTGVHCDLIERSPLGVTLFNSFKNKYGASAFITASHLPPEWNGVKFYWGPGIGFSPEENKEVQDIFENKSFRTVGAFDVGTITELSEYNEQFIEYLKTKFTYEEQFKVAVDCGNGATSLIAVKMFEDLGFEVISLFDDPDPRFPNRSSEPTEESLQQLADMVKNSDVDFGVGFDGDGDRAVFVDENGTVISSDAFGIIVAEYLLKTRDNNRVIINMECSQAMEDHLKSKGAEVFRIRVGHSFLSLEAKENDAIWGVENSGHAIMPEVFLFDDALILPLVFAKALEYEKKTVSELTEQVELPIKKRFDIKCSDDTKFDVIKEIASFFKSEPGEVNDLDGVALTTDNGRILVRVSNTSPKIRATIESMSEDGFNRIRDQYIEKIKSFVN